MSYNQYTQVRKRVPVLTNNKAGVKIIAFVVSLHPLFLAGTSASHRLASFESCCFSSLVMTATLLSFSPRASHGRLALFKTVLFSRPPLLQECFSGNCFFDAINSMTRMNTAPQSKQCSPGVLSYLSQELSVSQQALWSLCQHLFCWP